MDVNSLFARAEHAFRARRFADARRDLQSVLKVVGEHSAVLHLSALVEMQAGSMLHASRFFQRALRQAPNDPQIHNNYANLLDTRDDTTGAITHYSQALRLAPDFIDARLNRATTLQRCGMLSDALADLNALLNLQPQHAAALTTRGAVHRSMGNRAAADIDFKAALMLDPAHIAAQHGRARLAMDAGQERNAIEHYKAALSQTPDDLDLIMGLAEAYEAAGDPIGADILADVVANKPHWIAGHDSLARMRSEAGITDFAMSYAQALAVHPDQADLHIAYWRCLARGNRHGDALDALTSARQRLPKQRTIDLFEAALASEAGDIDRADAMFTRIKGEDSEYRLAAGRHALRKADPHAAAALLEPIAKADLRQISAWAHLSLAWRMLGDKRHDWLCEQPGLYAAQDLDLEDAHIDRLADLLRNLHRTKAHPIGQSLRGGTQTRGRLLDREEPVLLALRQSLQAAIARYIAALPSYDPTHPLLAFRNAAMHFHGSWSIRLTGGGFHIHHIHPEGVLSSAFYVALPSPDSADSMAGWLDIGAPPDELGLPLKPLATLQPQAGRLILFPSYLFHGTRPFAAGERLTVAFDILA